MKFTASRLPLLSACAALAVAMGLLASGGPQYCGRSCPAAASLKPAATPDAPSPTLAPRQKVVVVRVEADKLDLEVGWAQD